VTAGAGLVVIGGKTVENVNQYSHLGHIITSSFVDDDDISHRRNCFVGQSNNVLCFFNKLDMLVKLKLFKSYCSSMYGCELWALNSDSIENICVAWRKALRRVLNLPYNTHSCLLPLLSDTIPIYDELCKRSARFITSCIFSPCHLVQSVAWYSVCFGKYSSPLGNNAMLCCNRYDWSIDSFTLNLVRLNNNYFRQWHQNHLTNTEISTAFSLLEVIFIREGHFTLPDYLNLSKQQLNDIIITLATA